MIWEQRWHPLREEWVIVAAHRDERPWKGETVAHERAKTPSYERGCYMCPGNQRVSGVRNETYTDVFVFDNDHPCVGADVPTNLDPAPGLLRNRPAQGVARVVCYDPRHDVTLAELPVGRIDRLLEVWQEQYRELGARAEVEHVLIFENKGSVVGVSNPHPHCQIYATNFVFKTIEIEAAAAARHWKDHQRTLLGDILRTELDDGRRIVVENGSVVAFVPYFARYAYETFVVPKRAHTSLAGISDEERHDLAAALKAITVRFDNLWEMSFPYVMALHQAPTDGQRHEGFHFHVEFHPPLRRPGLLKYLAGPEVGGGSFLSDTSAEEKAAELRAVGAEHYSEGGSGGA